MGLKACVPQIHACKPLSPVGWCQEGEQALGCLGHEGGAPTNGISAFIRRDVRDGLSGPCEDTAQAIICEPRGRFSVEPDPDSSLIFYFRRLEL